MTTQTVDQMIADYLARLARAAAGLPAPRRAELLEEIDGHLAAARAAGQAGTEADTRTLLDRLGTPEEIVAAARAEDGPVPAAPTGPVRPPSTARETAAVAFLTLGSCIPVAGWVVGVILLWTSPRWRIGEKLLGTLVVPGGPGGVALFLALFAGQTCTSVSPAAPAGGSGATTTTCTGYSLPLAVGIPVLLVAVIAPFVVDGILLHRASKRAQ